MRGLYFSEVMMKKESFNKRFPFRLYTFSIVICFLSQQERKCFFLIPYCVSRTKNTFSWGNDDTIIILFFCVFVLQYLACLSTCSSNDKLSFDVGLQEHSQGEACWWTVHPASKQRSEGEKVRVGDDLILVSVATERYLVSMNMN